MLEVTTLYLCFGTCADTTQQMHTATHAKHMRTANASLLEQQWRDICEANATRIRRSPLNIEQTNNFACRVWCKPAFSHDRFWVYCRLGRVAAKYLV